MFFKSKEGAETTPDIRETVTCNECKCLLYKVDAQVVQVSGSSYENYHVRFYCGVHVKPYTKVEYRSHRDRYFKQLEVDVEGTPVGYVKEPAPSDIQGATGGSLGGWVGGAGEIAIGVWPTPTKSKLTAKQKKAAYAREWYRKNKAKKHEAQTA